MRRLVHQAENSRICNAPQTMSPLSPLRNPTPGLDAPFWNSNPSIHAYYTQMLNTSERYCKCNIREPKSHRFVMFLLRLKAILIFLRDSDCTVGHETLAIDECCPWCKADLRKRLLYRRSQANLLVSPTSSTSTAVDVYEVGEDPFECI